MALEPELRSKMRIITKCNIQYPVGANRPDVKVHHYDTSKDYIRWCVERSLNKIGVKYVDVLLLHRPDPLMDADEVAQVFKELKSEGKVFQVVPNYQIGSLLWSFQLYSISI